MRPAILAALAVALAGCSAPTISLVHEAAPECESGRRLAIVAQAVETASLVPCIEEEDQPWRFSELDVERGRARMTLVYLDPDERSATVELTERCDTGGLRAVPGAREGVREFRRPVLLSPRLAGRIFEVFDGGCVTTTYDLPRSGTSGERLQELIDTVGLFPREVLSRELEEEVGLEL
ncbi:MAG: hypothetical protein H0U89_09955 [Acidimicrobiia bacterium]|nr:hypothetical protein [Acidimicrobiia bacterium]